MSRDTVHDLLQFALERPECCYRTALSARHKGKRLDDFVEIGSIDGLAEEDTVQIVEGTGEERRWCLWMRWELARSFVKTNKADGSQEI